jgi:alpha-L-rhamnosidase
VGSGNDWHELRRFELGARLHAGKNAVAVRATNVDGPAGLALALHVQLANGTTFELRSDSTFRASNASAPELAGFEGASYDDSSWPAVQAIAGFGGGPWGTVQAGGVPSYFRRSFAVPRQLERARIYATALGLYELWLDGKRVGSDHLTPGWTDYRKRVQVQTYDVTEQLEQGEHVLGAILADGWFNGKVGFRGRGHWFGPGPNRLRVQLELSYSDGTTSVIGTEGGASSAWKTSAGPLLAADLLDGEAYDARLEQRGWAGWAMRRSSCAPAPSTWTWPASSPSGCVT